MVCASDVVGLLDLGRLLHDQVSVSIVASGTLPAIMTALPFLGVDGHFRSSRIDGQKCPASKTPRN